MRNETIRKEKVREERKKWKDPPGPLPLSHRPKYQSSDKEEDNRPTKSTLVRTGRYSKYWMERGGEPVKEKGY